MIITLTTEYLEGNKARVIPGSWWDRDSRSWLLQDPTPRAALIALKLFPALLYQHPELGDIRDQFAQDVRPVNYAEAWGRGLPSLPIDAGAPLVRRALLEHKDKDGRPDPYDFRGFQRVDLGYEAAVLAQHGSGYLGWERGLGKTLGAIALIEATGAQRVLIVTTNTSKRTVWEPEWRAWGRYLPHELVILPNAKAHREAQVEAMLDVPVDAGGEPYGVVWVVHYEALAIIAKMRARNRGWDRLGEWDLVIVDEAHHLANKKTQQTRALKRIPARRRLALSGSIIQNHAGELYSPLNWLFKDRYSDELRDWNDRFLDYVDLEGHREYIGVKLEQLPALRDELGRFMVYRRKADELDLPPITYQELPVELSPAQRRVYDDLERDTIAQLDNGEVLSAANGLALLTKLRQVATGLDLVSEHLTDSTKVDAALDWVDDPDEPFVVFTWFVGTAKALAARLGDQAFLIYGDVKQEDRADYVRRFQAGERRVMVATIKTLGESVTLSRASNVLFLDRSWNPSDNGQAEDRVAGGFRALQSGKPITIATLVAIGTVDQTSVTPTLSNKQAIRSAILGIHGGTRARQQDGPIPTDGRVLGIDA